MGSIRSSRCLAGALDLSATRSTGASAVAGPSRPRFISTSAPALAHSQAGAQRSKPRSTFGMKRDAAPHMVKDDDFGFGMSKVAGPSSRPRQIQRNKDVSRTRNKIPPAAASNDATRPLGAEEEPPVLSPPRNNLKHRDHSDLSWIRVHFSRSSSSASSIDSRGAPGTSSTSTTAKASDLYHPELINFAYTFVTPDRIHHLDPYIHSISVALTVPSALLASLTEEVEDKTIELLGAIWVRANELKKAKILADNLGRVGKRDKVKEKYSASRDLATTTTAKCYARFLAARVLRREDTSELGEEGRIARSKALLERFEDTIRTYREQTKQYLLPAPIVSIWAILRREAAIAPATKPGEGLRMVPPPMAKLQPALLELTGLQSASGEWVKAEEGASAEALQGMIDALTGDASLPASLNELDAMLADIRVKRENERGVALWEQWRSAIADTESVQPDHDATLNQTQSVSSANTGILDPSPAVRTPVLLSFFRFFARNPRQRRQTTEEERLSTQREEVLALIPKPWSAEVHHAVLRFHAKMDEGELPTASEARALEEEAELPAAQGQGPGSADGQGQVMQEVNNRIARNRDERLVQLKAAWKAAERDRVVDVKMYMLYVEGLGRLGDAAEIKSVWDKLQKDERVREQFRKAEGTKIAFPPTSALNHIISCALLIRDSGPPIALDLFHSAASTDSPAKCNVITINTILRHYATTRNVDGLTATIGLAEKLNLAPDVVTYTTLLQGLLRAGQNELAKRTMENMTLQGIKPNEHTAGLLISDLVAKGDRQGLLAAEDLMKEMKRLKMSVGVVPWTSLIGGYYRGGWLVDAKQARLRMKGDRVELNRVGYNMLLREAGRIASFSRPPPAAKSAPHTRWMRPAQSASDANAREMLDREALLSADSATQAYRASTRRMADTLIGLYQEMESAQPRVEANADTYTIMLQALVQHQRMEEAEWVLGKMREHGYTPDKATLRTWVRRVEAWVEDRKQSRASETWASRQRD